MQPQTPGNSSFSSNPPSSSGGGSTGSSTPSEMIDQAKQTAGTVVGQAKETVSSRLKDQFSQTAEGLHHAAEELHHAADELEKRDTNVPIAEYVDRAATQMDRASQYLRNKDLDMLVSDVERFAREKPAIFLGSMFGIGLLAARFLKSTPHQTNMVHGSMTTMNTDYQGMPVGGSAWSQPSSTPRWGEHQPSPGTIGTTSTPRHSDSAWSGSPTAPTTSSPTTPTSSPSTGSLPASNPQHPSVSTPGTTQPSGKTDDEHPGYRQSA